MNKKIYILTLMLFSYGSLVAQEWSVVSTNAIQNLGTRKLIPETYTAVQVDDNSMRNILWNSPSEDSIQANNTLGSIIKVMLADGSIDLFAVYEYKMMEDELAAKFPEIKTFIGQSTTDPHRSIRIDYTSVGFRAVISDLTGKTYIDPFQDNDVIHRIIYRKSGLSPDKKWKCGVNSTKPPIAPNTINAGDCNLRTYKLALAATGEYTGFHGGTKGQGQSAIVTTINRVNQVYEQDITVRLILVANNDLIVFTNGATDPYTNGNDDLMIDENQQSVDSLIGSGNYDVGHVFGLNGAGLAGFGVVCNNSSKARGTTSGSNPVGDPFDIDYVCHELGHQFQADHTYYNCDGDANPTTGTEPGSGSTIMGYAGLCGAHDIQSNSDAYFHATSLGEIAIYIAGNGGTCGSNLGAASGPPVIAALSNYNIPHSTPIILDANVTDPNSDPLTYTWEQMDAGSGQTSPPASTNTSGPVFRSLSPVSESHRYLPSIDNIINASTDTWEVLPTVARTMNFRLTVRDHSVAPGCTTEGNVALTVDGASGPFAITSQNTSATIQGGQAQAVTWNGANTVNAPVNCANVDIKLSTDGGLTYPTNLLLNTPNDGSQSVAIPSVSTTTARIFIGCSNNVFFDVNNANLTIDASCALTVTNTSGTASGSLRNAINCSNSGDVIILSSSLANQTIDLGNNEVININKNLTIQADPADNITVISSGSNALSVTRGSGGNITLKGFTIGATNKGTLLNSGIILENTMQVK